jgi:hypothetical protein
MPKEVSRCDSFGSVVVSCRESKPEEALRNLDDIRLLTRAHVCDALGSYATFARPPLETAVEKR